MLKNKTKFAKSLNQSTLRAFKSFAKLSARKHRALMIQKPRKTVVFKLTKNLYKFWQSLPKSVRSQFASAAITSLPESVFRQFTDGRLKDWENNSQFLSQATVDTPIAISLSAEAAARIQKVVPRRMAACVRTALERADSEKIWNSILHVGR